MMWKNQQFWLKSNQIKSTYFIRVHDPEYNIFDYRSYRNIKRIISLEHEIGLHSEALEFGNAVGEDAESILRKEIKTLELLFDVKIDGSACHGDVSQYNNLDFWNNRKPQDFGLSYEVYHKDSEVFWRSKYISNYQGNHWKYYVNGQLVENDSRSVWEHLEDDKDERQLFYNVLIHPRPWYRVHWRVD
ncbi:TPA: hypothetical protein EYN98_21635 [Candidatus Poribacteria bacterium]|nr:hypothetical protein [Candidatus Poribacteria bacterium]